MPRWVAIALIISACGLVYCVGLERVALFDRDEPRYAQTSRQMVQSGDWVVPRLYDEPRTAKPVFIYWCQASAMKVLGDRVFAARLPSVLAMVATLILVAGFVGREAGYRRAMWTTLVLGTSALVVAWSARVCLTDAVLLLWITVAQVCLYWVWRGSGTWTVVIVMSAAIALAGLTKGPPVFAVMGMTILALWGIGKTVGERDAERGASPAAKWGWGKVLVAIAVIVVIVAPWVVLLNQRAPKFLGHTVSHDVIRRILEPLEQHSGPPGYYLLSIWGTFFPWSLFLPMALVLGWRHRRLPLVRFALAWVVGPWVLFEFVQTKLPHYLLPCFVPLAFLVADGIVRCLRGQYPDFQSRGFGFARSAWAIGVLVIAVAPWMAVRKFEGAPVGATVAWTILGLAYAIVVTWLFLRKRERDAVVAMALGMLAAMLIAFGWYLPRANYLRLPLRVAEVLRRDGGAAPDAKVGDVQMIEFKEPSLAFYQGGTIREQPDDQFLVKTDFAQWPRWFVIREDVWKKMPESVASRLEVVGAARGLAYADKGKVWEVFVVRKRVER